MTRVKKQAFKANGKVNTQFDEQDIIKSFEEIINLPHDDEEKSKAFERKYWKLFKKIKEEESQTSGKNDNDE